MSQDPKTDSRAESATGPSMETILEQWKRERPDIDPAPMAVFGDLLRTADRSRLKLQDTWAEHGMDMAAMDVVLTLRRQGKGQALSPSALAKEMMLSASAMTNRLDRLEKRGLVKRTQDPNDRRGLRIVLTDDGFALTDRLITPHVENQERLLAALTQAERQTLRTLLAKIGD